MEHARESLRMPPSVSCDSMPPALDERLVAPCMARRCAERGEQREEEARELHAQSKVMEYSPILYNVAQRRASPVDIVGAQDSIVGIFPTQYNRTSSTETSG